jgi:hypothetical protein
VLPPFIVATQTVVLVAGERTKGVKSDEFCEMRNVVTYGLVNEVSGIKSDCCRLEGPFAKTPTKRKEAARKIIEMATAPAWLVAFPSRQRSACHFA